MANADPIEVKARLVAKELYPHRPNSALAQRIIKEDAAIIARHYRELVAPLVEAARRVVYGNPEKRALYLNELSVALRDYPAAGEGGKDATRD